MDDAKHHQRLRVTSIIAYWAGVALWLVSAPLLVLTIEAATNLHNPDPQVGTVLVILGGTAFVLGFLLSSFGLIVGSFVWKKRPWTVLCGVGLLVLIVAAAAAMFAAWVHGWI